VVEGIDFEISLMVASLEGEKSLSCYGSDQTLWSGHKLQATFNLPTFLLCQANVKWFSSKFPTLSSTTYMQNKYGLKFLVLACVSIHSYCHSRCFLRRKGSAFTFPSLSPPSPYLGPRGVVVRVFICPNHKVVVELINELVSWKIVLNKEIN
jgi:hypothetical protein